MTESSWALSVEQLSEECDGIGCGYEVCSACCPHDERKQGMCLGCGDDLHELDGIHFGGGGE